MQVKAKAKFIKISAKKTRLVANMMRGKDVGEALVSLKFTNKAAVLPLTKLLKSAISNAEETFELRQDNLFIKEIRVDEGPTLNRWRPRAFGRAGKIRKRSSHISIVLEEKVPTKKKVIKKKVDKSDIVKVDSIDDVKLGDGQKDEAKSGAATDFKGSGSQKGFVGKIFNRKAGDK